MLRGLSLSQVKSLTVMPSYGNTLPDYKGIFLGNPTDSVSGSVYGVYVDDIQAGTSSAGMASIVTAGVGRFNLYIIGTAQNYFQGRSTFGTSTDDGSNQLQVTGGTKLTGNLTTTGGMINPPRVVTAAGAVTVATTDYIIIVNKTSGAATTVNLPGSPTTGQAYIIKDGKGDANTNNITVTPAAGNIDGSATYVMNAARQAINVVYTGAEWAVY